MDAIEKVTAIKDKRILILGAGGAAKGIATAAIHRNANVTITNRTMEKATALANDLKCNHIEQDVIKDTDYDILINTTPTPIPEEFIHPNKIVMDITCNNPLAHAKALGCRCINGEEMFVNQAKRQLETWFPSSI